MKASRWYTAKTLMFSLYCLLIQYRNPKSFFFLCFFSFTALLKKELCFFLLYFAGIKTSLPKASIQSELATSELAGGFGGTGAGRRLQSKLQWETWTLKMVENHHFFLASCISCGVCHDLLVEVPQRMTWFQHLLDLIDFQDDVLLPVLVVCSCSCCWTAPSFRIREKPLALFPEDHLA